jgi:hypothetical protein
VNQIQEPRPEPDVPAWLDQCEKNLVHPGRVQDQLHRRGWPRQQAALIAEDYRKRFNEHVLGYSVLLVTTGIAALAAGTVGHILTAALNSPLDRRALAMWLSLLVCIAPFAVWAHLWAARSDREDPVAVWSRARRTLALVLLWACGIVGGARLLMYATQFIEVFVKAPGSHRSLLSGAINVAISLSIAVPLALWAYRFLHRFDGEDPTAPPHQRQRRRPQQPRSPLTCSS